nr:ABC transporter substrate binding protein [Halanaerobacter jeridensis]
MVLHSFHQDYIETKKVQQGIKDSFAEQKINLHLEYMDSKRGFEKKHFQSLYQLYKHKYSTKNIDLVIAVNSNAFNFVKDYQEQLFKQTPIVFCSINKNIGALIDANSHYYGNNEKLDINSTVELALKLHPKREQLVAFFANNSSGTSNRKFFEEQVATNDSIAANKYQVYQVNNTQEIKKKIDQLGTNNIIYLGKISRGDDNQYITLRAVAQDLVDYSNSPIYSSWSFYLDYGIIGGKLINNYQEGENAAHLALKLLKGENTAALNMINSTKYMFDYNKLKEYNVSFNKLPSKNKIINSPQYFYQKNQKTFWFITVTIILLVIIIVLLLIYVVKYREIKEELEIEEERLRCAVQGSRIGIWDWNVKKDKVRCSSDFMEKLGFNSNIISNYLTTLKKRIHPQDRDEVIKKLTEELNKTDFYQAEYRWKVNEGWKWILDRGEVIQRDNEGEMLRVTGTYQDISFQKEIETELKRTKEKLENIFAHNNIVFFSLNVEDGDIIEISGSCTKVYGYQTQEFYDDSNLLSEVIYPEDEEIIEKKEELLKKKETGEEHLQFEYRIVKKNGEVRWVEEYTIPVRNYSKEVIRLDGIVTDITERKEAKERLKDRAYYDALTGVYNRHIGLQILEEEKRKLASGEKLSVCFVDVNNLKTVNDNYGHKEGDRLIKLVAMTVSREIRTSDKLIRLGGDEFLICFPQCDVELADKIWQRIRNKFRLINQKTNKPYQISASHGIAEYKGQQEISVEELITIADEKMYAEKQKMKEEKAENY